ncbi:MAG: hypothetical protein OP8BY_1675 [Candidatus Saccharicenans subterraneus]|uniref:Uncharacterized protein n=1 Tax=Candidatus Saccharicenans subterraneus TaxID=2508984 RepID=A0A3E2BPC3_9BACT|nr:MAG: hypothetical protein OP8BY_1675 [Candidatus Saccharicenans subterraneum]
MTAVGSQPAIFLSFPVIIPTPITLFFHNFSDNNSCLTMDKPSGT